VTILPAQECPARHHPTMTPARPLTGWALVLLLGFGLAACGQGGAAPDGGAVADVDGAVAYAANCAVCHGAEGQGTAQGPPLVHIVYEPGHHPDEAFRRAIAQGVVPHHWEHGPMPALPDVRAEEVDAIIAHVRDLQREAGIID
jgi:mono/diheme cytochrome c family protein